MKTALFDLDGTLIDSRADLACAVNLVRQDFGLPPLALDAVVAAIGEGVRNLLARTVPERADQMELLLERQRAHYTAHFLDQTALYPGMAAALRTLKARGWRLGVVTNKPAAFTRPILEGLGVLDVFDAIVGGGDCPELKPHPAPLHLAAARMGATLDAHDWMVGDHFTDIEAAANAGIRSCFCRFGFGGQRASAFTVAVDTPDELLEKIRD
ncbi:MAG: HAD-IA family hydrolase [Kiritimatiellaeota bacterium]|nr:HAD-IA family hydrolase [Kiritimatiellota bacterium]